LPECGSIPHVGGPGNDIRHAEFFRTPAIMRALGLNRINRQYQGARTPMRTVEN